MNSLDFSNTKLNGYDVRLIRETLGLSQDRLSKALDVSPVTVYLWESFKRKISPRNQKKLAGVLEAMKEQKEKNELK